ncbi:hypothetical protein ATY35_09705 [Vibrio cidicii]|uniref:DUF2163 domain-containing protein n=1 Tax=Vibrio cidicii TaxID=1763883 RepID=A0ABR5W5Q0_9VIBR|nr:DUF2163 domain-containing protein [Vibrio cidicii]KYN90556.1 hypothetical protein ATY35_09705 [Vibrio cidicii]
MKNYPQSVIKQMETGHLIPAYLLAIELSIPVYFTSAGFDIELGGKKYVSSATFQGLDKIVRHAEMRVGEIKLAFSMTDSAITQLILGTDVYKRPVNILRVNLSDTYQILHVEPIWRGHITGKSDTDERAQIELRAASRWSEYEKANVWRTSRNSHAKRVDNDDPFKYAAKAAETIYWAGTAGG